MQLSREKSRGEFKNTLLRATEVIAVAAVPVRSIISEQRRSEEAIPWQS